MIIGIPPRTTLQTVNPHTGRTVSRVLLGNVVSTNVPSGSTAQEWSSGSYNIGAKVKIDALKCEYVSKVDGNTAYPASSDLWYPETYNDHRFRDAVPTLQSEHTEDVEVIFNVGLNDYLVGLEIDDVNEVVVERLDQDNNLISELYRKEMRKWVSFMCWKCRNVSKAQRTFRVPLDGLSTLDRIRVKLIGSGALARRFGVMSVFRREYLGCLQRGGKGTLVSADKYKVEEGDLAYQGGRSLLQLAPVIGVKHDDLNSSVNLLIDEANQLNFYVIEEIKLDTGVIIGSHDRSEFPLNAVNDAAIILSIKGLK